MLIAVDFDATIVVQDGRAYDDVASPLVFMPGAREAVLSLKRAGHTLVLWSARACRSLLYNPDHDPLVRAGLRHVDHEQWAASLPVNQARYREMVAFVAAELSGVFSIIDGGAGEKPRVDLIIDDRALRLGAGPGAMGWPEIARLWGADEELVDVDLLSTRICDMDLVPTGQLAECLAQLRKELRARDITFAPSFYLGDDDFWAADRATSVNVPWYLANSTLWQLVNERACNYSRDDVLMLLRHETGHALGYAFELWRRPDWAAMFGDFKQPYRDDYRTDSQSREHVRHLHGVGLDHYAQKHPDEDWAETFAVWLDPASQWRQRYKSWPGALDKLEYVDGLSDAGVFQGTPPNRKLGQRVPYTELTATIGQYLGRTASRRACHRPETTIGRTAA